MTLIYVPVKKTEKRRKLEREALHQLRRTRKRLEETNPNLLNVVKGRYEAMQQAHKNPALANTQIPVDRAKNLETIARFIQITGSEAGKKILRELL